jgi:DNA excision repair protein ERCC-2
MHTYMQAAQCVGRVIRSKTDYGIMVLADQRYARTDKKNKLPSWIRKYIKDTHTVSVDDLSVSVCMYVYILRTLIW